MLLELLFVCSKQDRIENGESRWQTIGLVHDVMLLLVAHAHTEEDDEETIRIISARKADSAERRIYAEAH